MAEEPRRQFRVAISCFGGGRSSEVAFELGNRVAGRKDIRIENRGLRWGELQQVHSGYDVILHIGGPKFKHSSKLPQNTVPTEEWFGKFAARDENSLHKTEPRDFARAAFDYLVASGHITAFEGGPRMAARRQDSDAENTQL